MAPALHCGNCGGTLRVLPLAGHYGRTVEIDLCAPCHLVWFDLVEAAQLSGPGLLALIGEMAAAQSLPHRPLSPALHCARCSGPVRTVHNRTRWGPSLQMECNRRHGAWQSFAQFLSEKGLLRPLSSADRQRAGELPCVNCGGLLGRDDRLCPWCQSVPALVDVARLAQALDPEGATAGHAVHGTGTRRTALACLACGAALPATPGWSCPSCGATLAAQGLAEAHRQVAPMTAALAEHARRPAPAIVRQRLQAQAAGLDRQRERAAAMQAEAEARSTMAGGRDDGHGGSVFAARLRDLPGWVQALLGAALLALLWWWG